MKIIQVVQEFGYRGGVESVAYELDRAFRASGDEPGMMACIFRDPHPDAHEVAAGLKRIPTKGAWRHVGRLLAMPAFTVMATQRIRQLRKRDKNAVFLCHGDTLEGDICVIHAVNEASIAIKRGNGEWRWRLNPMHALVHLRDRIGIGGRRYRRVVAVSHRVAGELRTHYDVPPEMIEVIPNGVNLTRFSATPDDRAQTRQALGVPLEAPMLLFVGHEFGRKGLLYALQALTHLPDAWLVVAGAGEQAQYLELAKGMGVAQRVLFLGARKDLPELNRAADAFVFPTAYEAFPLVCIEAMGCGLPLFATPVGGIEDYLEAGVNGYPIERNGEAIARVLKPLLQDRDAMRVLRQGALETARRHEWGNIAKRYAALVATVYAERASTVNKIAAFSA